MYNLLDDLSCIHGIDKKSISSVLSYIVTLITDYVSISNKDFEKETNVDLGIGTLSISFDNNDEEHPEFTYTFTPSNLLLEKMKKLHENSFESELSNTLKLKINNKLNSIYKELLK